MNDTIPTVIVFDVNETLLDIATLEPLFERLFGEAGVMREWFAQMVLYSEAMTLAGAYAPFGQIGAGVLRMVGEIHGVEVGEEDTAELAERVGSMPVHDDVAGALETLAAAGFRLVTLTNSAPGSGPSPLAKAGLEERFERTFSVAAVRRFKPAPETYASVTEALGVGIASTCLVAAHAWDTLGAQLAGGRAALLTRPGNAVLEVPGVPRPDIVAPDLGAVAEEIVSRWGGR